MKKLIALSVLLILGLAGCSARLDQIMAIRLTEESGEGYREETGTLTREGFVPISVTHQKYENYRRVTRDQVHKVNGKLIVPLAFWNASGDLTVFKCTKETVTVGEVPYVFVEL
jgi:hypothetical protein